MPQPYIFNISLGVRKFVWTSPTQMNLGTGFQTVDLWTQIICRVTWSLRNSEHLPANFEPNIWLSDGCTNMSSLVTRCIVNIVLIGIQDVIYRDF